MDSEQAMSLILKINSVFPKSFEKLDAIKIWLGALMPYDEPDAMRAVDTYLRTKPYPPKPADIISLMPERPRKTESNWQRSTLETDENGKTYRVYRCLECKDSGLMTWRDKEDRIVGRPCRCQAGKERYTAAYNKYYGGHQ